MKQLICEICNSTNFVKEGGSFVCQNCGMKYSSEEAKNIINGIALSQTKKDCSKEIKNKVENAIREFNSNNLTQAYSMLSDVLNVDPENTDAIIYKSLALGWQASISDPKIAIVMEEYARAFKIIKAKSSGTYEFTEKIITPLKLFGEMGDAALQAHYNYLQKENTRANNYLQSEGKRAQSVATWSYSDAKKILSDAEIHAKKILNDAAKIYVAGNDNIVKCMGGVAVEIFTLIDKDYEHVCEKFISQLKHYLALIQRRCKNGDISQETISFANKIENVVTQMDNAFEAAWEKALVEENQKYWNDNPEKQAELIKEKESIEKKIKEESARLIEKECELDKLEEEYQTQKTSHEIEAEKVEAEIHTLINSKGKLGIFQFKEKKSLTQQIEEKEATLDGIYAEAKKERREKEAIFNREKGNLKRTCKEYENKIEKLTKKGEEYDDALDNGLTKKKEERKKKKKEEAVKYWMTMGLDRQNAENYVNLVLFSPFND